MNLLLTPRQNDAMFSCLAIYLQTSIMACEFNGGVVIGADSRGTTG